MEEEKEGTPNKLIALLSEVLHAAKTIGVEKTIHILKKGNSPYTEKEQALIDFIVNKCCMEFEVRRKVLFVGRSNPNRVNCLDVSCYLLKKYMQMDLKETKQYFNNRDMASISRGNKRIDSLDDENAVDGKLLMKIRRIEKEIERFIIENKITIE